MMGDPQTTSTIHIWTDSVGDRNSYRRLTATESGLKTDTCETIEWDWLFRAYFKTNRDKIKSILSGELPETGVQDDGGIDNVSWRYCGWSPGREEACLDADFTQEQLFAIAMWMKFSQGINK